MIQLQILENVRWCISENPWKQAIEYVNCTCQCHILSLLHMSAIFVTYIYLLLAVSLQEFGISLLLYFQSIFTLCNQVRESHEMTTTRELFVTADDFGYCPDRNKGIIDCFLNGGITDTSLMVNANYTKQAAELGLKYKLPIGELTLCIYFFGWT